MGMGIVLSRSVIATIFKVFTAFIILIRYVNFVMSSIYHIVNLSPSDTWGCQDITTVLDPTLVFVFH